LIVKLITHRKSSSGRQICISDEVAQQRRSIMGQRFVFGLDSPQMVQGMSEELFRVIVR
jgi:hypothetical protein